ncbi:hypothetical protein C4K04_0390 [Pseudomonas chlororaphis]|uniref:Uncharacterized protein n=1 Tax=Pseudomonas chlororaphis TaxID=587753 RepID=A0A3G7TIA0_9PSED|nr:hypothetical protein C4K04_0390 [Pseudomonas chlororaphis]
MEPIASKPATSSVGAQLARDSVLMTATPRQGLTRTLCFKSPCPTNANPTHGCRGGS